MPRHPSAVEKRAGHPIKSLRAAEQNRPELVAARAAWRCAQPGLKPERLVFIDETWSKTNMARRHGRSQRAQPCRAAVPHGHWKTTTFVTGPRHDAITAPMVIDGAMNSRRFGFYVRHLLAPSLSPGDSW